MEELPQFSGFQVAIKILIYNKNLIILKLINLNKKKTLKLTFRFNYRFILPTGIYYWNFTELCEKT